MPAPAFGNGALFKTQDKFSPLCLSNFMQVERDRERKVRWSFAVLCVFSGRAVLGLGPRDPTAAPPPLPLPGWGQNGEKKAKAEGRAKGSVTDRHREWTATATTLTRRMYKTNSNVRSNSHRLLLHTLPAAIPLPPGSPPLRPKRDVNGGESPMLGRFGAVRVSQPGRVPTRLPRGTDAIPAGVGQGGWIAWGFSDNFVFTFRNHFLF